MRKIVLIFVCLVLLSILAGACLPNTYINPVQIHITPGDEIKQVRIAVDAVGRKHIAGVVDDRIVYYRTQLGEKELALTMTMSGSGTNWIQYDPDIAVTDGGDAFVVWVEQRGGLDKYACYRPIPQSPPFGGYQTGCVALDEDDNKTRGITRVVGRGNVVYAVYDRLPLTGNYPLLYKELTGSTTGLIVEYPSIIYQMDIAIDSTGKLHVVYIDHRAHEPYIALWYRSNAQTDGTTMDQIWRIVPIQDFDPMISPSITFHKIDGPEMVTIASILKLASGDHIVNLQYCKASDCSSKDGLNTLPLPYTNWDISEVKILGGKLINEFYGICLIGSNSTTSRAQVWCWDAPFDGTLIQATDNSHNKYNLELVDGGIPIVGFLEKWSTIITDKYRISIYDSATGLREIATYNCLGVSSIFSDMAANPRSTNETYPVAGVWNVCGKTWFSTNVFLPVPKIYLPLITR